MFYAGLLTAAVSTLAFGVNLFTPAYVLPVLIPPLVLMLLREPLSHLLAKNPHWREFSVGEVLGTGFFELFETLLSYLTNTLSFMRVGAYAITHVGLMLVVHMLAGLAGGVGGPAGILILVLGNAFVMGFEGPSGGHPGAPSRVLRALRPLLRRRRHPLCPEKNRLCCPHKRVILRR